MDQDIANSLDRQTRQTLRDQFGHESGDKLEWIERGVACFERAGLNTNSVIGWLSSQPVNASVGQTTPTERARSGT